LTVSCWQLSPQFGIFAIFVKDDLSNFGLITNACLVFRFPFHPANSLSQLAFRQSGTQRLAGVVSTDIF
jgi:hypothetical protein